MERGKLVAIITGAISLILAIAYLALVQFLDSREMIPAPVSQLPPRLEGLEVHFLLHSDAATGRIMSDRVILQMLDHTEKMTPYRTSMKIDYDEGRSLEVEAIFGNPLRTATAAGADLPLIGMLYRQLKFRDAKNRPNIL